MEQVHAENGFHLFIRLVEVGAWDQGASIQHHEREVQSRDLVSNDAPVLSDRVHHVEVTDDGHGFDPMLALKVVAELAHLGLVPGDHADVESLLG